MKKLILAASAFALAAAAAVPGIAQDPMTMAGTMTAADVGVQPLSGTSATDYVKMAADGDMYEIQSSKLALSKSKNPQIKMYAREMIKDHTQTTKSLMAALSNADRTIAKPSMMLSATNAANVQLLKKAPKGGFDQLYIQQQMQSHQTAWALQKGYATDGTDPSLKQVAATAVPVVEHHLTELKAMPTM